ncbi:hypothetical protein F5883DRAFT_531381 [Diaporthe sp. PMI_573]|nr:hypothetical protein F5883DRAFT_531381 [Diaporthaceae sp. PMI_573]
MYTAKITDWLLVQATLAIGLLLRTPDLSGETANMSSLSTEKRHQRGSSKILLVSILKLNDPGRGFETHICTQICLTSNEKICWG